MIRELYIQLRLIAQARKLSLKDIFRCRLIHIKPRSDYLTGRLLPRCSWDLRGSDGGYRSTIDYRADQCHGLRESKAWDSSS